MQTEIADSRTPAASNATAAFRTYDPRLEPIAARVFAGERLDFADGLALYGSSDFLGGEVYDSATDKLIAKVSYNGRVWDAEGNEIN